MSQQDQRDIRALERKEMHDRMEREKILKNRKERQYWTAPKGKTEDPSDMTSEWLFQGKQEQEQSKANEEEKENEKEKEKDRNKN